MKSTAMYGMTNVTIEKEIHSGNVTSWIVYADTERWGKHQIMAQFGKEEWAENWCKENGVVFENSNAWEMAEKEVNTPFGKIQIGNTMYRRLYIKDGHLYGHSPSWYGFRDITTLIQNCKMTGEKVGKTTDEKERGRYKNFTVKFGNECTW